MDKVICYHVSSSEDRESILALGLLPIHPVHKNSAAESYGNMAGAAVYLWLGWPDHSMMDWRKMNDVWAIEMDANEIQRDPSNLGHLGAVYTKAPIAPDRLRFVPAGEFAPADMFCPNAAKLWARNHPEAIAELLCKVNPAVRKFCIGEWDEDNENYRPVYNVVAPHDTLMGEMDVCGDMLVQGAHGFCTVRDLVLMLNPTRSAHFMADWEFCLMDDDGLEISETDLAVGRALLANWPSGLPTRREFLDMMAA